MQPATEEMTAEDAISYLQNSPNEVVKSNASTMKVVLVDDEHVSVEGAGGDQIMHIREFIENFGSAYFRPLENNEY